MRDRFHVCYSLFAFYLESETLVAFYLESESSFVSTLSVNSGSYSQFLKRAVSRKYSKIWFRFTSEIKVEQENYHNEINFFLTYPRSALVLWFLKTS